MYQYEEYDFDQLLNLRSESDIDPNDPALLYAMAQCYRLGKGVTADEQIALEFLREAARAGSQPAREELDGKKPAAPSAPKRNYNAMSIGEISRLAEEENDLQANLLMHRHCRKIGDDKAGEGYLRRCVSAARDDESQDLKLRRKVFEEAGAFYALQKNMEKSRHFYEIAKELESVPACRVLLDYYSDGIGGEASRELEKDCLRRLERLGGPDDLYQCAMRYLRGGERHNAFKLLEKLMKTADTARMRALAGLELHKLDSEAAPYRKLLPDLWAEASTKNIQEALAEIYSQEPDLPITAKQAMRMAGFRKKEADYAVWLGRAAKQGSAEAKELLRKLEEEKARQEAEAAERRRKKAEEKARREAEEAERRRKEAEEKARREAEEAERRRKEAEEKARQEAEAAERRRKEEDALHQRAEDGDAAALLTLGDRLAAQKKPAEARALWLRGAEGGSGTCCLRLAEQAYQQKNYTYVLNMCGNAATLEPALKDKADKLADKAAAILREQTETSRRVQSCVDGVLAVQGPQLALCILVLALSLASRVHLGGDLSAWGWTLASKLLVFVLTVCTLQAAYRYDSVPEIPGVRKEEIQEQLQMPLLEQGALTLLCALAFAIEQGSAWGLLTPYFWGLCVTLVLSAAAKIIFPKKKNPLFALLGYALGKDRK